MEDDTVIDILHNYEYIISSLIEGLEKCQLFIVSNSKRKDIDHIIQMLRSIPFFDLIDHLVMRPLEEEYKIRNLYITEFFHSCQEFTSYLHNYLLPSLRNLPGLYIHNKVRELDSHMAVLVSAIDILQDIDISHFPSFKKRPTTLAVENIYHSIDNVHGNNRSVDDFLQYLFDQGRDVQQWIMPIIFYPGTIFFHKDFISPRRLALLLIWFADITENMELSRHDFITAGRRIKKYILDKGGFAGIISDDAAQRMLTAKENTSTEKYFIIGIDIRNLEHLVIFCDGIKQRIRGDDLHIFYSPQSIYKPLQLNG